MPKIVSLTVENCRNLQASGNPVFFFDMDNTLYSQSTGIDIMMEERIKQYFINHNHDVNLALHYYHTYGLSARGLLKHHEVDPEEYDNFVDGGLHLDEILKKDEKLINLLKEIKTDKWVFTNAGM